MSTKIKRALFLLLAFAVLCAACSRKEETAKEENPKIREQMALAEKYLGEQKFDEAIEALLEAVELDPEDVDVYLKLSEIYADQEMDMEAMDILEQGWRHPGRGQRDGTWKCVRNMRRSILRRGV